MLARPNPVKDLGRLFFWYPLRWLVLALTWPAVWALGGLIGRLDWLASGAGRIAAMAANAARGLGLGRAAALAMVRANLMNHARNVLEFIKYPQLTRDNLERVVSFEGLERLQAARAGGRGVLLATAHFGAKQLLQPALGLLGIPLNQMHYHMQAEELTWVQVKVAQRQRQRVEDRLPCRFLAADRFLRPALEALKNGEVLIVAADGVGLKAHMDRGYQELTFLGQPMLFPVGLLALARKTGAALLPAFVVREGWLHRIVIGPELDLAGGDDRTVYAQYVAALESQVRARPELWEFWEEFDERTLLKSNGRPCKTCVPEESGRG
jgi:KDO2-lipid IV(A) lauroyltransferase